MTLLTCPISLTLSLSLCLSVSVIVCGCLSQHVLPWGTIVPASVSSHLSLPHLSHVTLCVYISRFIKLTFLLGSKGQEAIWSEMPSV
jgi:hypothetical protein